MKFIVAIFLYLLSICVQSAPVRTSLCCCGCNEEPCPIVGLNCPNPQLPCGLENKEIVYCSELQRLWDMANVIDNAPEQSRQSNSITPFISQTGQFNRFRSRIPEDLKPELFDTDMVNRDVIFRDLNKTTEIRFSPSKPVEEQVKQINDKRIDSLEKMNHMLSDLQSMISTVKGLIDKEVAPKTEDTLKDEDALPDGVDNISEEEERQAIDDVIKRMKGAFRKMTKDGPPVNEVDSSVSAPVVDVQSLSLLPINTRPKRASKKNAGNCNDEQLREIIDNNIGSDVKTSKRQIQKAAEKEFGGTFNVICSPCEFSFVISSQKYCEGFKDQVACFVFLQPPTSLERVRL